MQNGLNQVWEIMRVGSTGIDDSILIWLTASSLFMFLGPAYVATVYVLREEIPQIQAEEIPSETPEKRAA